MSGEWAVCDKDDLDDEDMTRLDHAGICPVKLEDGSVFIQVA